MVQQGVRGFERRFDELVWSRPSSPGSEADTNLKRWFGDFEVGDDGDGSTHQIGRRSAKERLEITTEVSCDNGTTVVS